MFNVIVLSSIGAFYVVQVYLISLFKVINFKAKGELHAIEK